MSGTSKPHFGGKSQAASKQRSGKERIDSLGIPKPKWMTWWDRLNKEDWSIRLGIALLAAVAILGFCRTWRPAFAYRMDSIPARDLITRVTFQVPDKVATDDLRLRKQREVLTLYRNSPQRLSQLRATLRNRLFLVLGADAADQLSEEGKQALSEFVEESEDGLTEPTPQERFALLKETFANDPELTALDEMLELTMLPLGKAGLLRTVQHSPVQGSQRMIRVFEGEEVSEAVPIELSKVRVTEAATTLEKLLRDQFRIRFEGENGQKVGRMVGKWLRDHLGDYETLQYDDEKSQQARQAAADAVQDVQLTFYSGQSKLADGGKSLTIRELELLRLEWEALVDSMRWTDKFARIAAFAGMIVALYLVCGSYIWFVDDKTLITDRWKLFRLLALMATTIILSYYASRDQWRTELVPLVITSLTAAVVLGRELGLLVMAAACLSVTLLLGADLADLVTMAAACTSCVLLTGRIRSRTHLVTVGSISAAVTILTVVGVGIVTGQTLSAGAPGEATQPLFRTTPFGVVLQTLLTDAGWSGLCIMVSATAMTGLLPLVERIFHVQTDLSLLELGEASHPLLRRLAQRAPGTYNHSINVASIAEAAADAIGANGLLVRVGAYFHDIGKMFKPEYFIENQTAGVNQHDSLQPAMSTLVIIAHVKDGADLARNHHLPEPLVDFILQHHGTTLVEYFYREAAKRSEDSPNRESVCDKDFRYPGPKPQTLEAAVLMLADTVESASRTLVDPTPSRIANLVDAITQKKVGDGQFDECGLTFAQLHQVRQSLIKSLTAIYHARVKYPGQQSA